MDDLYHQEILDHYYHPDNFGEMKHADKSVKETNASCGDSFTFYVKLSAKHSGGGIIEDIKFQGTGCAISTAAASILTGYLKGKPVGELERLTPEFMQHLIGSEITPARLKCLMLPAKALKHLGGQESGS